MFEHQTGDDFDAGGKFLSEPGWYHLCVVAASDTPVKRDGTLMDGAAMQLDCTCLHGTAAGCRDKSIELVFYRPKSESKDGGAFQRKVIDRALIAMNVIDPSAKQQPVRLESLDVLVGQQFIAQLEKGRDREGKESNFLRLAFADIYHVDDPAVAAHPKDLEGLKLLPSSLRRIGSKSADEKETPKPAAAAKAPINADDLEI